MSAIYSMTGFGGGAATAGETTARVELRSVNHRGAKIVVRSRPALNEYEKNLRDLLAEKLHRGAIDATVTLTRPLALNNPLVSENVRNVVAAARQFAAELHLGGELTISDLLQLPGLFGETFNEPATAAEWEIIRAATAGALRQMCAMRETEGGATAARLLEIVAPIENFRQLARQNSAALIERQREKLTSRLAEIAATRDCDRQALERELVFFADRVDINEELDRLESHVEQFRQLLRQGGEVGKRLEFLAQEFLREINTTASKANDLTITAAAVEAKNAVEKLKEQAANLE
ncbi:MAG: YicC family protein [Planctomycetota bacterium]|nr:YicC family protein [Planctomycetota bacterium]